MALRPLLLLLSSLALVPCGPWVPCAGAQLRASGVPASARADLPSEVPVVVLPLPEAPALRAAAERSEGRTFRYGQALAVGVGLEDAGRWDELPGTGELVWRLELTSPGAHSLGVTFSEFDLPSGAQVFLYDPRRGARGSDGSPDFLGAYDEADENPNGVLAVQPLRGDRVVIEYVEPAGTHERPRLVVGELVHDYLDLLGRATPGGVLALSCLVDINCPAGDEHQDIKRAVVWLLRGGGGCSGSILNNTNQDGTPYLLTAEHCGDMTNAVIVFAYERTGCGSGSSTQSHSLSGAQRLAVSIPFDGQLYLLNQTPPASYRPFYAGWSLDLAVQGPTTGISHPGGQPKKIQIDHQAPFRSSTRWNVDTDVGIVQPGSSGSPLFDEHERVIGPLSTGTGDCSSNLTGYGRLDGFYATRALDQWLDPAGWGLSGIDGYDPFEPYATPYVGDGSNPTILYSDTAPRLGTLWQSKVDTSLHPGASATVLSLWTRPAEGPSAAFGQLLVDTGSTRLFQAGAAVVGNQSLHAHALPNDPALAGRTAFAQAFVLGGSLEATNGLELVFNF